MFIVFEGLDGSGGTTQLRLLAAALRARGRHVVETGEPSRGPVGRLIREQLRGGELADGVLPYLFAADRRDHVDRVIAPGVAAGQVVLSDRHFLSSLAYQAPAVGLDTAWRLNEAFRAPDLVLMLDAPVEVCLARVLARGQARERFETAERLAAVAAAYEAAIARCRERGDRIARIDARASVEDVHRVVLAEVGALGPSFRETGG